MLNFFFRRFLIVMAPTLLGITILVFFSIHMIPGTYVDVLLGTSADVTPEQIEQLNRLYGLDKPLPVQYLHWMGNVLQGDLGVSLRTHIPVIKEILSRLEVTTELAFLSLIFSIFLAFPLGMIAAIRQNTFIDSLARITAMFGLSVPNFLLGTIIVLFISIKLPIIQTSGFVPLREGLIANLQSMILPTISLGMAMTASTMRMVRSSMLEELRREYVTVAIAKGLRTRTVYFTHVLRNALLPVLTNIGIQAGYLIGGTVVIEELFALPGIGRLVLNAVYSRDYPVVMGTVLFIAAVFVVVNLITDITYGLFDPRVKLS